METCQAEEKILVMWPFRSRTLERLQFFFKYYSYIPISQILGNSNSSLIRLLSRTKSDSLWFASYTYCKFNLEPSTMVLAPHFLRGGAPREAAAKEMRRLLLEAILVR